jgi:hypothetical protein
MSGSKILGQLYFFNLFAPNTTMSVHTRHQRHESTRLGHLRRYWWYAVGEIFLIFAGITLALWFSNWNETRRERVVERRVLTDIIANLHANAAHIEDNIKFDRSSVQACNTILAAIEARGPWLDDYEVTLDNCRWWSSPFLSAAAYDSLKLRGTDLITDRGLRDDIVKLYELNYAYLVDDIDKGFWQFQEAVLFPVFNRYIRDIGEGKGPGRLIPNDWIALLDSREFSNALFAKRTTQRNSVEEQQFALDRTRQVAARIDAWLAVQDSGPSD